MLGKNHHPAVRKALGAVALSFLLISCATNPVTGVSELSLVDKSWEIKTGAENYPKLRQMSGGDYLADPSVQAYVERIGQTLARASDRDLPYEFVVVNDATPNAWALPGGKIGVHRGLLLTLESEAELAAVLAHEIVHAAARHSAKDYQRSALLQGSIALLGNAVAEDVREDTQKWASYGAKMVTSRYSREAERESDAFGMTYMQRAGYDPQGAVALQQTFVNLSAANDARFATSLFASHPPSQERLQANRAQAQRLPKGGQMGIEAYARAMAQLREAQPAYDSYDQAGQAAAERDYSAAKALIENAIRIEPRESLFYGRLGDIQALQAQPEAALESYQQACKLNPTHYYPYLRLGLTYKRLGVVSKADDALRKSFALLPTQEAQAALAQLSP